MPVQVNLKDLETESVELEGALPAAEYGDGHGDELIHFDQPLRYQLTVAKQPDDLLVTGTLATEIGCECSRCLQPFRLPIVIDPFGALIPLAGEDALPQEGDIGDLTPQLREDIYLALPTHPLCRPDCRGLPPQADARDSRLEGQPSEGPSPWAALDRLKL